MNAHGNESKSDSYHTARLVFRLSPGSSRVITSDGRPLVDAVKRLLTRGVVERFAPSAGGRSEVVIELHADPDAVQDLQGAISFGALSHFDIKEASIDGRSIPLPAADIAERVTVLLELARNGDASAKERLARSIHGELKQVAAKRLHATGNKSVHTTELVNLAYERLLERDSFDAQNKRHLFAIFKNAMTELLIDQWRARQAQKRGGGRPHGVLMDIESPETEMLDRIPELLAALEELKVNKPEEAEIVSLKFFCGRSSEQIQELLDLSPSQVRTKWENARRWLFARMQYARASERVLTAPANQ